MATFESLEKLAMTFPEVTVEPHFEKISFRVKKKIFTTFDGKHNRVTVKLSEADQDVFSLMSSSIYAVDNKWGKQGWTFVEMDDVSEEVLKDVITTAYCEVAPKKLAETVRTNREE